MNTQPPPSPAPILKRLKTFLTRPAPTRCTWSGEHNGPPVAAVTIARTCGHHSAPYIKDTHELH